MTDSYIAEDEEELDADPSLAIDTDAGLPSTINTGGASTVDVEPSAVINTAAEPLPCHQH